MNNKDYTTIDELLNKFNNSNKQSIQEFDDDDDFENETIDDIQKEIKKDKLTTEINKNKFINEIKSGLGNNIKTNPNIIKKVEKKKENKIKQFFINLFTKF